mgnify:CR=1 FL=1
MDFTSGEDEILLITPVSANMNLTSDGLELLHGTDLMTIMNNISEILVFLWSSIGCPMVFNSVSECFPSVSQWFPICIPLGFLMPFI